MPRKALIAASLAVLALLAAATPALAGTYRAHTAHSATQLRIELTGYSWQDNTPPGSATVSHPILHNRAGGTGTYSNPITVAVPGANSTMQFPPGTRFYLAKIHRYVIVEDSGATKYELPHLDLWIDGRTGTRAATNRCMDMLTGATTAIRNAAPGLPVTTGPIYSNGKCRIN
jgi:hypothetical protein